MNVIAETTDIVVIVTTTDIVVIVTTTDIVVIAATIVTAIDITDFRSPANRATVTD
jgi:hypothetical protein